MRDNTLLPVIAGSVVVLDELPGDEGQHIASRYHGHERAR